MTPHPLEGFGGQFNTNLFTTAGEARPLTAQQLATLQAAIDNVQPGFSRILVRKGLRADTPAGRRAPEFVALLKTIELAQNAGAGLNLTYWGQGPYADEPRLRALRWPNRSFRDWPDPTKRKWPPQLTDPHGITQPRVLMERFAGVLEEIRQRGFDCVTSVTIQNEVNGAGVDIAKQGDQYLSMRFYELLYRFLDAALRDRNLRDDIRFIAGDLVERGNSTQDVWLRYLHRNMEVPRPQFPSVLDGYSIHVYWEPTAGAQGFPAKPERRLTNLGRTAQSLGIAAPIYVTEYGVRQVRARVKPGRIGGVRIDESDASVLVLNNATRGRQQKVQGLRANQEYFVVAWNRDGHGALASLPPLQSDGTGAATVQLPAHGIIALSTRNPGI